MGTYFLKLGANLVITSRKLDVLQKTADEMEAETGGKVLALACDVRNYSEVENMLNKAIERFGSVNALLNNAAGNFISPTERLSANAFSTIIDIVLKGSVNCSLALGKYWIKEKMPGNILNIITTYAFTGSAYVVPSACAKGGVLAMTRSLAAEWGRHKIRTNAIAPGPFPTKGAWERLLPGVPVPFVPATLSSNHGMARLSGELTCCTLIPLAPEPSENSQAGFFPCSK
jgi:NAD(P)-dependent dehydrogenase (short-subunit alcohol dehydrogenase family)